MLFDVAMAVNTVGLVVDHDRCPRGKVHDARQCACNPKSPIGQDKRSGDDAVQSM